MKTTELVESLLKSTVENLGFELCDVEFLKEYGNWVLTLYIDKPGGVSIDDCERVSRAVDPVLDEKDPIEQQYYLSVSSLGLDRPLKKDADFKRNLNREVSVKLYAPMNGEKEFSGTLVSYDETGFILAGAEGELRIARKEAALIRPVVKF